MGTTISKSFGVENVNKDDELCYKAMRDNYGSTSKERCLFNPMCEYSNDNKSCIAKTLDETDQPLKHKLKHYPAARLLYKGTNLFKSGEGYTTTLLRHK